MVLVRGFLLSEKRGQVLVSVADGFWSRSQYKKCGVGQGFVTRGWVA